MLGVRCQGLGVRGSDGADWADGSDESVKENRNIVNWVISKIFYFFLLLFFLCSL